MREYPNVNLLTAFSASEWTPKMIRAIEEYDGTSGRLRPTAFDRANADAPWVDYDFDPEESNERIDHEYAF
jgi:hypothetical protein